MIKILFCCHGNICRSTMAQSVFTHFARQFHLDSCFEIDSAATSTEEIGNPPHHGTKKKLQQEQIPLIPHRARQMTRADYTYYDYLIGMDHWNMKNMLRIVGGDPEGKMALLLDYTKRAGQEIADPWYTGNFDATYDDVVEGCTGFLEYVRKTHREI